METTNVFLEHQLETGTSFGIRADNSDKVFIPARLVKKYDLEEENVYPLVLMPSTDKPDVPWRAVSMSVDAAITQTTSKPEAPQMRPQTLPEAILEYFAVEETAYAQTAPEIAKALDKDPRDVQLALTRMHNNGDVIKAQVTGHGRQERASKVLWATDASWFSL